MFFQFSVAKKAMYFNNLVLNFVIKLHKFKKKI